MTTIARHKTNSAVIRPSVSFHACHESYFIFQGIQSLQHSPSPTFKAAVLAALGKAKLPEDCQGLLKPESCDLPSRWFLLNALISINRPLQLYNSFDSAEKAMQSMPLM